MAEHEFQPRAQRAAVFLHIGLGDAGRHVVVKAGNRLAAVLVVLVGLYGDAGQCGIATDVLRLAEHAVARRKAALEQRRQIDLRAGGRQRQEVEVVDVDVALAVGARVLRPQDIHVVELLGALRAVLEHRAHRGIAVDVRVLALDVGIRRVLEGDVLQDVHEAGLRLPGAAALGAVEDVGLRRAGVALLDEHLLHPVLHALHCRHVDALVAVDAPRHERGQPLRLRLALGAVHGGKGAQNRCGNLALVIRGDAAIALSNGLRHGFSLQAVAEKGAALPRRPVW